MIDDKKAIKLAIEAIRLQMKPLAPEYNIVANLTPTAASPLMVNAYRKYLELEEAINVLKAMSKQSRLF